jgi:essential nuclear protein 1
VDEHEKDVFDKDGYYDVMDSEAAISKADQTILQSFHKTQTGPSAIQREASAGEGKTLAELIMQKMSQGTLEGPTQSTQTPEAQNAVDVMNPKVIEAYKKLATVMKSYRSGKLPKTFKIIPLCANWEELLFLTRPEQWSPHATCEATKIFASNLNARLAQKFYYYVLLPNVRANIETYKKLNCHLYMAVKKAIFKTGAFFKGFLLPLAEDATAREAVIIGSILAKMSITVLDSAAAIIKLM